MDLSPADIERICARTDLDVTIDQDPTTGQTRVTISGDRCPAPIRSRLGREFRVERLWAYNRFTLRLEATDGL